MVIISIVITISIINIIRGSSSSTSSRSSISTPHPRELRLRILGVSATPQCEASLLSLSATLRDVKLWVICLCFGLLIIVLRCYVCCIC